MSADGYVLLRASTLAWLLERHRAAGDPVDVPADVAVDLREAVVAGGVRAPTPAGDRLRALGPILSLDQHLELLQSDEDLKLPRDRASGEFWRLVARVTYAILINEAEAVARLLGESDGKQAE